MRELGASRLALWTVADYLSAPAAYDPDTSWRAAMEHFAGADKKALDALLKSLGRKLDKPRVSLLKAELEAHADKRMSPRLWAKEVA